MKKKILVTGGAGFIGSHLVGKLLSEKDWSVTVVDNFNDFYEPAIKRENIREFERDSAFSLVEADICNRDALEDVFDGQNFDVIVHLAARAGVRPSLDHPRMYTETNVLGTVNLLECALASDTKKFVFGSSSSVYGSRSTVPFVESEDTSRPISPYAATKIAGEALCHSYSHLYGIDTVCLRFFTVYGARQRPDLAIHKFSRLIADGQPIPVFGDGTTRRDYTYIDDIISGVMAAIDYDQTPYEVFNLGESQTVELGELIELLEDALGERAEIERHDTQPGDVPLTCADITKARDLLGYEPSTPIEEGIIKFVDWFKSSRALVEKSGADG